MAVMAEIFAADVVKAHFLPVLKALSKDKVANIRMNEDSDVRYYSVRALSSIWMRAFKIKLQLNNLNERS